MASFSVAKDRVVSQVKEHKVPVIALVGIIVLGVGYSMTRTPNIDTPQSNLGGTPDVHANLQKNGVMNSDYQQALHKDDLQRQEEAQKTGDSFVPTFTGSHFNDHLTSKMDDSNAKPSDVNNSKPPELPKIDLPTVTPPEVPKPAPKPKPVHHYYSVAETGNYEKRMKDIIEGMDDYKPSTLYSNTNVSGMPVLASATGPAAGLHAGEHESLASATSISTGVNFILPDPGTVLHGHFLSLVDSRYPGAVLGQIDGGAYNGARLIGNFQAANDKLMVKFATMTVVYSDDSGDKKTKQLNINAVAVDPNTLSSGMADYVNRHLLAKIGGQMATSFMSGLGSAIQQSGSTAMMTASGGTMISEGSKNLTQQMLQAGGTTASQVGNIIQQEFGNKPDTVKIYQNKPFGLLFLDNK